MYVCGMCAYVVGVFNDNKDHTLVSVELLDIRRQDSVLTVHLGLCVYVMAEHG